jgi:membrane protein DedA with SNARE-associated domain
VITQAAPILAKYGYAGIFLANFVEGIGIPLPGQTLLMAGAVLALEGHYDIRVVVGVALCASFLGPCLGFWLGRRGGRKLLVHGWVNEKHLQQVEQFFRRHGILLILLSRFVDGFRQLTPVVAGSMGMSWRSFLPASLAGSVLYVGVWGVGVYALGHDFHQLLVQLRGLSSYTWALCALLVIVLLGWLVVWRRGISH